MEPLPEVIETERLILKGLTTPSFKLAEEIYAVVDTSRDHLRPFLAWVDKTCRAEDVYQYLQKCQMQWDTGAEFNYQIILKQTQQTLGIIDVSHISKDHKSGEIGYWLGKDFTGHGYMHEAVLALESVAFQAGLNRIGIVNDTRNIPSAKVAEKAGYHLDGVLRQAVWQEAFSDFGDQNVWSKLKSDWTAQQK